MKHGRILSVALLAVLVASATLFAAGTGAATKAKPIIGYELAAPVPELVAVGAEIKHWASAHGMGFVQNGGQLDQNAQIAALNALINKPVNVIVAGALNPAAVQPVVDSAVSKGIKYISYGTPQKNVYTQYGSLPSDDTVAEIQLVALAAKQLKAAGKPCDIGIIEGLAVVPTLAARNAGMSAGAKAAGCTVLDKQTNAGDSTGQATSIASNWASQFGSKMTAIVNYNDNSALGAVAAVNGSFKPLIYGFGANSVALKALKAGQLAGEAGNPAGTGEAFAWLAYEALHHVKVPAVLHTRAAILTAKSLRTWRTSAQLLKQPPLTFSIKKSIKRASGQWYLIMPRK